MHLPSTVRAEVDEALATEAKGPVAAVTPVSGGCINHGCRLETRRGDSWFLKWSADAPDGMFAAETDGLDALRRAASSVEASCRPVVPEVLAMGRTDQAAWLLMEWIPPADPGPDSDERLGRGLALLHGAAASLDDGSPSGPGSPGAPPGSDARGGPFGWHRDNWIGSLPQSNRSHASWAGFWRDERIVPQLVRARDDGYLGDTLMDRLVEIIPAALDGVECPHLLHGDLWSGNTYPTMAGAATLIDPAVYRGDGEVDLAMTELFGGFGRRFYAAYRDTRPVSPAYEDHRRDLYQLYYLLVHVNLFGRGYVGGTRRAAERVVASLT